MKHSLTIVLVLSFFLQGCVTPMGLAPETECAVGGYKLVSFTNSDVSGVSSGYGSHTTTFSGSGRSVQCAPIETAEDREQAKQLARSAEPIYEYNDKTFLRSAYGWAGAVFWIVPGLGLWYYYGVVKRDEAREQSEALLRAPASE